MEGVTISLGQLFLQIGTVILALALMGRFAGRIGLTPIPLYLIAGILMGQVMHLEGDAASFVSVGAEIGAILLLFMLGLEYTSRELEDNLRANRRIGLLDLALNFTPGVLAGLLLGFAPLACVLLGGVTYLTSSGIVSKVLADLGRFGNRETPVVLAVCVLEDVAMAFYLPVMAALLIGGTAWQMGGNLLVALGAFGLSFFMALRYGEVLSRLMNALSAEVLLLSTFGLVLAVAGLADIINVSAAIGAFLVGIALSGEVAERVRVLVEPLRDLFAAVFFVFFGLEMDVASLPDVLVPALLLTLVTSVTKFIVGWHGAAQAGVQTRGRIRAGVTLIPRGEFSILIAGLGAALTPVLGPLTAAYVLMTAILGPVLARFDGPLSRWVDRRPPA
ncbi:potassium transporter [Deinococcus piscis]|uniref:Potassium transporter n=1 Tax=Deinococcus piscis TaxID=394230 RepID=A0ABQ3K1N9_9DEIO|nr:cation:proton antiporter [Deinococcus piscis]GHF99128.1 potassium transporter [Deinococcus piscis]